MIAVLNARGEICGIDDDPELAWYQARRLYNMTNEQLRNEKGFTERRVTVTFVDETVAPGPTPCSHCGGNGWEP